MILVLKKSLVSFVMFFLIFGISPEAKADVPSCVIEISYWSGSIHDTENRIVKNFKQMNCLMYKKENDVVILEGFLEGTKKLKRSGRWKSEEPTKQSFILRFDKKKMRPGGHPAVLSFDPEPNRHTLNFNIPFGTGVPSKYDVSYYEGPNNKVELRILIFLGANLQPSDSSHNYIAEAKILISGKAFKHERR